MAWSSVTVCHGGPKKMQSEENSEWLRLAGIDVIKLKHKKGRGTPSIRGFQRTDIYKTEAADGRVSYKYSHSSMRDTAEPCNGRMPLVFTLDKTDGYLYAYLPDT
ncbi:MAG: hypothetical protein KKF27_22105, partial [Gammaproteobacteria bacterium]|nr:hypothetical protein [Gammaproteobacteria bacterium]